MHPAHALAHRDAGLTEVGMVEEVGGWNLQGERYLFAGERLREIEALEEIAATA